MIWRNLLLMEIVCWVYKLLYTHTNPGYPFLPRRGSSLLVICGSLLVYGPGVVKHSVGGYTGLVVPIGFGYVLGRWYLLLEIRYQQKGRSIWDGYNWASLRWCIVLGEPRAVRNTTRSLLIFPRVVLGGGCGLLERNATSLLHLMTPHELFSFGVMGMHDGESSSGALPLHLFFFYCNGQRYVHTLA